MNRKFKLLMSMTVCIAISATSLIPALAASPGTFTISDQTVSIFKPIKDNGATGDHVHGSSIVELPSGELLCVWFQGNGERDATTTRIMGARSTDGGKTWLKPFVVTDAQDIADINPVVYVDAGDRLWFFWYPVLAGRWQTSQPRYAYAEKGSYELEEVGNKAPNWTFSENVGIKLGKNIGGVVNPSSADDNISQSLDDRSGATSRPSWATAPVVARPELAKGFVNTVKAKLDEQKAYLFKPVADGGAGMSRKINEAEFDGLVTETMQLIGGDPTKYLYAPTVADTITEPRSGYPYARRLGWQTKDKPFAVDLGNGKVRLLLPLYSDMLEMSIMAFTEYDPSKPLADNSVRWEMSEPIVGIANIQATMAQRKDGTIVAYMRDNGPRPYRVVASESKDKGLTWSTVKDVPELQDPGVGHDLLQLKDGNWAFVHVDTESNRNTLAVALSDDEGKTWKYRRHLALDTRSSMGSYHYPAITQAHNGDILISFSRFFSSFDTDSANQSLGSYKNITFSRTTEDWIKQGDPVTVIREYESIDREVAVPASFNISKASDSAIKALFPSTIKAYTSYKPGAENAVLPSVDLPVVWDVAAIKANYKLNSLISNLTGVVDESKLPQGITSDMLPFFKAPLRVYLYNDPNAVAAQSLALNKTELALFKGQSEALITTVLPSQTTNKTVLWSSSDSSVATVDTDGIVTAVKKGAAVITARTLDGNFTATANVEVRIPAASVTVTPGEITLNSGQSSVLAAVVTPDDSTVQSITWSSSDENVVVVNDKGEVTAKSVGQAIITAKVVDGSNIASGTAVVKVLGSSGGGSGNGGNNGNTGGSGTGSSNSTTPPLVPPVKEQPPVNPPTKQPDTTPKPVFTDVNDNYLWAQEAIEALASKGIVNGTSETTFSPEKNISRADFMTMVVRALNLKAETSSNFDDVNKSDYYYEALAISKALGIADGVGGNNFNPQGEISRQDLMVLVSRALQKAGKLVSKGNLDELNSFKDASSVADYAKESVALLVEAGIIEGSDNLINPEGKATRAEVATIVYRVLKLLN
ncbi:exo-alpha-sialidase [Paenibacillus chondroitinus]|uniref:Exo-alpha-sialidase n=1 Tax=Paenibacillus chondroitinus TaxID=59842 RepID=A0ABU6D5G5_9BACL|nr:MULTISPECIES: exo-alpha-sialidase [Paenibacillus]MCY9660168.1 exo-alpha-sialidase [Paenibacillus anseongense]MEB4792973.1 exo-alpha-sialidase [Paenibacillus chondroitinus]